MWGPSGPPFPPERPQGGPGCRMSPVGSSDRKRRRNHTNTLQELAMLLPIPLQASSKKLTKKEILLHVLHYIEHLQRSIDVAKSLLLFQPTDKEACCGEVSAQEERPCPPCETPNAASDEWLPTQPWSKPLPRQELVFYDSCEEEEEEAVDAGPWLSAWPPEGSPQGSPLVDSPRTRSWPGAGQPSEVLGLSPSLFTSPGRLLPGKILPEGTESVTQALFGDVCLSPQSSACSDSLAGTPQKKDPAPPAPGGPLQSLDLFQSAFSLDHCYLSLSETSKTDSSPSSGVTELVSLWNRRQEASQPTPDGFLSSSDEDSDCTWTPTKRASPLPTFGRKRKRSRASGSSSGSSGSGRHKESKKAHCPFQLKKKCVNGFIMFCRLNRKQYIRACPGTASTAATKELAHLWRVMTKQERRPYCIKARKFSRQHNRIVRQDCSSEEDDRLSPKPFHLLLAEKALCCPGLACMVSPLGDPVPDSPESV